jgi:iron complex outermembrane receptor protein
MAFGQTEVSGTVTDGANGDVLPGVNVQVQGTQTGTATDAQGQYTITVPGPDAQLIFSFVGYQQKTVRVGDRTTIDVTLQPQVRDLEEVVVTGYGQQRRVEISGSVASVNVADVNTGQASSPQELLKGRVSGVSVIQNSGEPGAGVRINVRGQSSISASNDPLYVVDGVPINNTNLTPGGAGAGGVGASSSSNPLALLNPNDIENIQILKDAAATAIYGSQGANGVVLITTKSGSGGQMRVSYSGKMSASVPSNTLDVLDAGEYRNAVSEFVGQDGVDALGDASTDWQDEALRTAMQQEHNLSLSGGTQTGSYRASLNYLNQEGLLRNSGIERMTGRLNAQIDKLDGRLSFNTNLTGSYFQRNHAFFNQGGGFQGGVIKSMIAFDPTVGVREDGEFSESRFQNIRNPVALLEEVTDVTDQRRLIGNFRTELDVTENLTAEATLGADIGSAVRRAYIPISNPVGDAVAGTIGDGVGGRAAQNRQELSNVVAQTTLKYDRELFGNAFDVLGGFEYERETWQTLGTSAENFNTDTFKFSNLGAAIQSNPSGSYKALVEQISFFGRANYNLQDRYFLQATLRRDGSSVFGDQEKFGLFPSGSIGWRISEEPFMSSFESINNLKVRLSYGVTGNQAVPPYQSLALLSSGSGLSGVFGQDGETVGVAQTRAANPDLKWEQTSEVNVGVDFLVGSFDGSVDVYQRTTDDLLLNVPIPQPAPSGFALENVGEVQNTGVEFTLDALVMDRENMSLELGVNASSNRNEIKSLGGRGTIDHTAVSGAGLSDVTAQRLAPGKPIGSYYAYVFTGINQQGQETFADFDEDGNRTGTTTSPSDEDKQFIGNPVPDIAYGFNLDFQYGDFDFSAFFRGEQGRELFNNTALELTTKSRLGSTNLLAEAVNDGTDIEHSPVYSSRWVQDASFFRLDNLTIGYNVPQAEALGLTNARVYATAQNLFVITPYEGYDPEVNTNVTGRDLGFRTLSRPTRGVDYTSYPFSRTFTLGVQLGF